MTTSCKLQTDITVHHILILFSTFISYDLNIFMVPWTSFTQYLCKDVKQCCQLCSFITPISHTLHQGFLQHWLLSLPALHQTTKLTAHLAWLTSTALTYIIDISQNNSYALPYSYTTLICMSSGITENW